MNILYYKQQLYGRLFRCDGGGGGGGGDGGGDGAAVDSNTTVDNSDPAVAPAITAQDISDAANLAAEQAPSVIGEINDALANGEISSQEAADSIAAVNAAVNSLAEVQAAIFGGTISQSDINAIAGIVDNGIAVATSPAPVPGGPNNSIGDISINYGEGVITQFSAPQRPLPLPTATSSNFPAPVPVVPGTLDASDRPQFFQGTPEFFQASQLASQASRDAFRRAARDNGLEVDFFITGGSGPGSIITAVGSDRVFLEVGGGRQVDITGYFEGLPKQPVAIDVSVPTYGTTTVETPFRTVTVQALPDSPAQVTTAGGPIQIDANSDVAKFLQWQGSQPDPVSGGTIGETWARQGISNPYSNPTLVENALSSIARRPNGEWSDPNWPAYQGSNRTAYETATAALADVNVRNTLMAENGWDMATFDIWALRSTNPAEAARQDAIAAAASGFVVGPGPSTTALSSNGATAVTTTGTVNSQGFATSTVAKVVATAGTVAADAAGVVASATTAVTDAVNTAVASLPVPVLPDIAGIATGFAEGFTAGLPELPSIEGALRLTAAQVAGLAQAAQDTAAGLLADIKRLPAAIPDSLSPYITTAIRDASAAAGLTAINDLLVRQNATIQKAKEQATLEARNNTAAATTDWRVRLQLAEGAKYLYKDSEPGILGPLLATNGVIFPYTPSIETAYTANYDKYDLTHSNYRGYFYKNSAVNDINIRGTFTAQDTFEADYLLAVIHFFRSVTKMFYGQGDLRGAPPPLVYLSGFGDYQFNKHPCLVSNFSYSLPTDVDYIRAGAPNNYGNLFSQRAKSGGFSTSPFGSVLSRLQSIGVPQGAEPTSPTPSMITQNVNNLTGATYVPTKIEINITLLPTNTRAQVSQQFNLKKYADGSLIKGGYW
jgi:hypothetical protein